ncbi:hypothetical protein DES53_11474 [Roseimicrobium gellanilyticum]|uniref:Uncharacterized protein n=1 Tax=Roseimicrobium gellanilyticum TaxID=748857 RepID=A0A366H6M5_9BACT|nr:hypothetical protein DES53_11474 [Roseimicrobium gellanilyticum]
MRKGRLWVAAHPQDLMPPDPRFSTDSTTNQPISACNKQPLMPLYIFEHMTNIV